MDPMGAEVNEVGFFDMSQNCAIPMPHGPWYISCDMTSDRTFYFFICILSRLGSWSNYPFFESGNIIVSSIEMGLYVLKVQYSCCDSCVECLVQS